MEIQNHLAAEFNAHAIYQMELNLPRIEKCLAQLSEEEVWQRPNSASNSIGNLMVHLSGNIRQWILAAIGDEKDIRNRDLEFEMQEGLTKEELYYLISHTVQKAVEVIKMQTESTLLSSKTVQGYEYSVLGNILHVVEHFSYHVGQIAYWTKMLKNKDLGFYADNDDLNKKVA